MGALIVGVDLERQVWEAIDLFEKLCEVTGCLMTFAWPMYSEYVDDVATVA